MADNKLDLLENKLTRLELRIFGNADKDVLYPKDSPKVIDHISHLNQQVEALVGGKPVIQKAFKSTETLERYLDPDYEASLGLSTAAKTELILADEEHIRKQAANLETIQTETDVLDSEHIKLAPVLGERLHDLAQIHIKQQDNVGELTEETKNLLGHYNSVINLLSKQFAHWNEILTKLEVDKKPVKQVE